tara:strand:+ start:866 stop:1345 length:480 start_codon:yes stop_codon:yes gene_type:complete
MKSNVDKVKYIADMKFGNANQKIAIKYIEDHFKIVLKDENIKVKEFPNTRSVFDYYVVGHNILIELKSRRNSILKYPTQMVGQNKIKYGRTKMRNNNTRIFFAFLLEATISSKEKELYIYEDLSENILRTKECGNYARNDKKDILCLINNRQLNLITSF